MRLVLSQIDSPPYLGDGNHGPESLGFPAIIRLNCKNPISREFLPLQIIMINEEPLVVEKSFRKHSIVPLFKAKQANKTALVSPSHI
jgi:hypothetical protein